METIAFEQHLKKALDIHNRYYEMSDEEQKENESIWRWIVALKYYCKFHLKPGELEKFSWLKLLV